ncbi:MAG: DUF1353 domain-containing protein [Hyphomicrobiales bacterium]|nr:DUF1353 domain-containing protein [Hyphomicrobiales bacterium]
MTAAPRILPGLMIAACLFFLRPNAAGADFIGDLVLEPAGCETTGHCTLGADFGFEDTGHYGWQAAKGLLTDGASIPPWAQPLVGSPFDKSFIKAAVLHDHYCDRHVRPWRQTHRMFHEALIKSGVEQGKAGIMYFAVLVGGPKWVKLIKGKPCPIGMGCINQFSVGASIPGSELGIGDQAELLLVRPESYASAQFANAMQQNLPELSAKGDALTEVEVEALAEKAMGNDFYFKNGDEVGTVFSLTLEAQ